MTTYETESVSLKYAEPTLESVARRPYFDLFLISFLILFMELACIRWFGSTVVFLTFFTNIVLMATFLGMSIGCMTAGRRINFMSWVLPVLCIAVALAITTFNLYQRYNFTVAVGGNAGDSPQLIYFGTEYRRADISKFVVPLEVVGGGFFVLIAIVFVGLGQVMGRAFDAIPSRIGAYTINVLGSLAGIVAFGIMSWTEQTPHVWFFLGLMLCLYFVRPLTGRQITAAMFTLFLIAITAFGLNDWRQSPGGASGSWGQVLWSPYYKIAYAAKARSIDTNNIAHQQMLPISEAGPAYMMPHLLNRDAGGQPFQEIMIIGAGSGNDVSAALKSGTRSVHVDAVEIDPVIARIGFNDHPDKPYSDGRVTLHNDDGRRFVRKTSKQYDLISYALVDSLVLHSGYSSLRLESFLFTRQAMEDIKAKLRPGGVFTMYNFYRQGWVVGRLAKMAHEVFGVEPIVISMPYQELIKPDDNQKGFITYLMVGKPDASGKVPTVDAIRAKLAEKKSFWINEQPEQNQKVNAYGPTPPDGTNGWKRIAPALVLAAGPTTAPSTAPADTLAAVPTTKPSAEQQAWVNLLPSDNWPFLYLRERKIPAQPGLSGIGVIGGLSLVLLLAFTWPIWFGRKSDDAPVSGSAVREPARFNLQMFFLGAGFMLLETKGVVHMALLFGSTWVVNSIVFFAILVMILLANLFVLLARPKDLRLWYILLGAALLIAAFVPMSVFLVFPDALRVILSCAVFFIPVFFAGVIFAASFRESKRPDVDFGSNIAGIILGGLSEQLSLIIGFNLLLLLALGFYFLSAVFRPRMTQTEVPPEPAAS